MSMLHETFADVISTLLQVLITKGRICFTVPDQWKWFVVWSSPLSLGIHEPVNNII